MKKTKTSLLCRLRLHKWKDYGDQVVITWSEPQIMSTDLASKSDVVYTKAKCLRCGIRKKRILAGNTDGTMSCVGWSPLSEEEYNEDVQKEQA